MFISPAYAQDAAAGGGMAMVMQILPLILIFGVFYFLLIRPQQKKQKEHRALLSALKRGDRVLTSGGIIATVTKVKDGVDEVEVEIAPNVRVSVLRATITDIFKPAAANDPAKG
ncbi:preprotein translocase subunit YajC [Siccirubricoccus sp. KC 17139]|uniref:Sec translocon accessory complex subunit YajC n=1 Tax=Siccirubricoccus soli TaxID=2899147 RepID=A0ABT1D143_9PROT|nr:preprotein translocase subunit YajC [Siccirubricoccus soli]MCO6415602.1 preprotein translocase subunit YajC [Siccirubricoccus soli]MCP2681734.1 preprotein translocase subunit YajC [Siccirubricoccus soli]